MNEYYHYILISILLAASSLIIYKSFSLKNKKSKPRIKKLFIYPIKSIKGVQVEYLDIQECGVRWNAFRDRCLVLIGEKNQLITLRNRPKLAHVSLMLDDNRIILNAPDMNSLTINYESDCSSNELITFDVWGQTTQGYTCETYINEWFSEYLDYKVRLIKFVDGLQQSHAVVLDKVLDTKFFYHDECPLHLMNTSSIEDLNKRLNGKCSVSVLNFRPNLLIDQVDAYEEDQWKQISINGVHLELIKPCVRCMSTTTNPLEGITLPDGEPLKTLKTYRMNETWSKTGPLLGLDLAPIKCGTIKVGDEIEIIQFNH